MEKLSESRKKPDSAVQIKEKRLMASRQIQTVLGLLQNSDKEKCYFFMTIQ